MGSSNRTRLRLGLEVAALILFVAVGLLLIYPNLLSPLTQTKQETMKEAMYYTRLDENTIQCQLCFRTCVIREGQRGFCANRLNKGGTLYTLVYGKPVCLQVDPIEKEPLFHVTPKNVILGIGTTGCNFRCSFCQNWRVSTSTIEEFEVTEYPIEYLVQAAKYHNCSGIHFTYTEPTVFYEFMLDTAKKAQEEDLMTAFHTNGAMNPEPLRELLKHMDAVTVDLKGFSDEFYEYVTEQATSGPFKPPSPALESVLRSLKIIKEEGVWLEIVNLVIPTVNDDMDKIREMSVWIRDNLGCDVPLHFNRFFPAYKLTKLSPTPVQTLENARRVAMKEGLNYVYVGNTPGHEANSMFCPQCKEPLIIRYHFAVLKNQMVNGTCGFCGYRIPGIWERRVSTTNLKEPL